MLSRVYHKTLSGIMDSLVERTRKVDTSDEPYIHGIPVCPSSGNFVVVVYPPPVWSPNKASVLFIWLGSSVLRTIVGWYSKIQIGISMEFRRTCCTNWTRKLHFDGGYGSMEAIFSKGILGMRALHKLYRCVARFPNIFHQRIR